ncbi:MAG: stage V sporulation protein D [Alicyclobacillus sp.]|nr:stage V sporulation protein D [Alicyclobacillus sp.]
MRRRLVLLLLCLVTAIGGLIVRLGIVQGVQAPWLKQQADDLHSRTIPVEGVRGTIYDTNGKTLVYTATAPGVMAIPAQVTDKPAAAQQIARILGMQPDKVLQRLRLRQSSVWVTTGSMRLTAEQETKLRNLHLPGIYITDRGTRAYPYGSLAASVLGITGSDNQGLTGIEKQYDSILRGGRGYITLNTNAKGQKVPGTGEQSQPAPPGDDVELTIDAVIQQFVEREVEAAVAEYNPDHVTAIVEDPKTGAILAMANYPSFNPADWRNYPPATYNHNLAIWQTFEPGSTFKIVTLSAALQENQVKLNDQFFDPGYYEVAGHKIRCWKAGGHGSESFLNVVENSCNPGFIALGERLGKETLFSYIKKFGFGAKTGIDLPGEGTGILFNLKNVGPLELATTAFGQGVSVTPIQQVMAMGAIANGGVLMKPHVLKAVRNHETGQIVETVQPQAVRRVISASTDAQVRQALESVVAQGSGSNAYLPGYRVAGKTGTAQVAVNGHYASGHYIVSFIGMAPANDPKLVAYVAIDYPRPKQGVIFGGVIAAPIVGRILYDSLNYLGVPPSNDGIPKKYKWGDTVNLPVPNFVGMTYADAQRAAIQSSGMWRAAVSGQGKYVVAQSPAPGTALAPNSTVRLYLGDTPPQTQG